MKTKSEFKGTCQCCGRVQMLPNGELSKHGYTTQWGFFEGTCPGSNHQPFELSCEMVKYFIASAENQIASLKSTQKDLRMPATSATAWVHDYRKGEGRQKGGYIWRQVEVIETEKEYNGVKYNTYHHDTLYGPKNDVSTFGTGDKTLFDVVTRLNGKYADSFNARIQQLETYVAWQRERFTSWVKKELTKVVAE